MPKCAKCGREMEKCLITAGFTSEREISEGKWPSTKKGYRCLNKDCEKFNYPIRADDLEKPR